VIYTQDPECPFEICKPICERVTIRCADSKCIPPQNRVSKMDQLEGIRYYHQKSCETFEILSKKFVTTLDTPCIFQDFVKFWFSKILRKFGFLKLKSFGTWGNFESCRNSKIWKRVRPLQTFRNSMRFSRKESVGTRVIFPIHFRLRFVHLPGCTFLTLEDPCYTVQNESPSVTTSAYPQVYVPRLATLLPFECFSLPIPRL
jgi:hypothetical protein